MDLVGILQPSQLADIIRCKCEKVLIVDARTFCEYNTCHVINAVNVWSSKIRKKRLQQNSISVFDFLQQACQISLQEICLDEVVVYDQSATNPLTVPNDTFLHVLLVKLASAFKKVFLLQGGFLEFQSQYYEMCEDSSQKGYLLTSFSQPCLPVSTCGPTKILPFLFLGSQHDANNKQLLLEHNISYELNVSTSCPKPEFMQDSHFLRISVNDNFSAKLLPHFGEAFRFIDKVREVGGRVLVHCLAGISRSPTIVISYVMKYLHLHYDEAYRYVKTRRPTISPNINFVGQLLEFDLHLFGKRVLQRSPLRPIYVDDNDVTSSGVPSSVNSPLLKSSSSSCLTSTCDMSFPFPLNRSLPSLRLNKSFEEVQCFRQSSYSPSTELDSFLFDFKGNEPCGKTCSSSKLPSSPVSPPPSSPEFSVSFPNFYGDFYSKNSVPGGTGTAPAVLSPDTRRGTGKLEAMKAHSLEESKCSSFSTKVDSYRFSSTNKENEEITVREEPRGGMANTPTVGIIPDTPRGVLIEDTQRVGLILTENSSCVACDNRFQFSKKDSFDEDEEIEVTMSTGFPKSDQSAITSDKISKNETFRLVIPPQHTYLKRENSAPEHAHSRDDSLALPPKTMRSSSGRKVDLPHLPRSYSSSETYLNTRMRLEKQSSAGSVGSNTRKSFSSDEVGRGFQGTGPPPTPTSGGFHKESYTNPLELARCDSWSTSGLGSEISDWDSVQGDVQSMEDAQGPFDAVFAEVFPGEGPSPTGRKPPDEKSDRVDSKSTCFREKKAGHDNMTSGARKSCSALVPEDSLGVSPAPRPVSLPGVSGTYNVTESHLNNVDMGVELDEGQDWTKEEVPKLIDPWNPPVPKKGPNLIEHPPVNTKTMGDDVKYIMAWYKFDSSLPSNVSPSKEGVSSGSLKEKRFPLSPETKTLDSKPLLPLIELPDPSVSTIGGESDPTTDIKGGEKDSLHERWQWWDNEFKKKIRTIKKNVSLTSWDSTDDGDDAEEVGGKMEGFHLAQELMQSMEDLLEREICEIKERTSSLSTRFGLKLNSSSDRSPTLLTSEKSEDSGSNLISPKETTPQKISSCPFVSRQCLLQKSSKTLIQEDIKDCVGAPFRREKSLRARSEPPACIEENLYRVKSCPGISPSKNIEDGKRFQADLETTFRFPKLILSKNGHCKRYSCSALDFHNTPKPTFESCPDVSQAKHLTNNLLFTNKSSSSDSPNSSHSSFNRLLKVS